MGRVGHAGTWRWIGLLVLLGCGHGGGPAGEAVDAASVDAPCTMTITGAISAAGPCQVFILPHSLDASHAAQLTAELLSHVADKIQISDDAAGSLGAPRSWMTEQSTGLIDWAGSVDDGTNSWTLSGDGIAPASRRIGTFTLLYQPGPIDPHERYPQAHGTLDATLVSATAGTVTVHVAFSQAF